VLSNDEFKAIFEASPDGCVVVSEDGSIRGVNPRVEELFGWSAAELMGRGIEALVPDAFRHRHHAHRQRFVSDPHSRPMGVGLDLLGQRQDGSTFPVEVSLSPWRQADGALSIICSVRDVSALRRLHPSLL
jgi:protein-histidine pros-kinase